MRNYDGNPDSEDLGGDSQDITQSAEGEQVASSMETDTLNTDPTENTLNKSDDPPQKF